MGKPLEARLIEFKALQDAGVSLKRAAREMGVSARSARKYAQRLREQAGEQSPRFVAGTLRPLVLALLTAHPDEWFSAGQIAKAVKHSSPFLSTGRGLLPALVAEGLIEERVSARNPGTDVRQVRRYRIAPGGAE